ncbi:minor capsid protein [Halobacterium salinarum]|uniref:minor capsid protein n=1 Tax=Halobacterium salinarum TaxID=2242 RepID=UPI002553CA40|nr:minor capsid protein [Halobacterium salinarum]MDL0133512.1 minor capsid protein [Halobacterium salinarum]
MATTADQRLFELTASNEDPTQTKTIRQTYARRLRGAFGRINAAIREAVVKDDIFGLRSEDLSDDEVDELLDTFADARHELHAVDKPPDLSTLPPAERVAQFEAWLEDVQESEVLEVIDRGENIWIRRAYERGIKHADTSLRQAGAAITQQEATDVLQMPIHERRLQVLFARNYSELTGITNAVSQQISRELSSGLAEGVSPSEIGRRISDRISKIGKTRATTLARTEVMYSHSEATLTRYEQQGVEKVGIEPEFRLQTAGDLSVCDQCEAAAGEGPWSLEDLRGSGFQPPLHPNCRCTILPVVNEAAEEAIARHPAEFVAIFEAGGFASNGLYYEALAEADGDRARELTAQAVSPAAG